MEPVSDHDSAVRFYARLLALYPRAHRDRFGHQMLRVFEDGYRDATRGERGAGVGFWLAVLWDEFRSITREHAEGEGPIVGLIVTWATAVLILPAISAVSDWHNLVAPAAVLAAVFLAVPGSRGFPTRLVTVLVALVAIESVASAAQAIHDQSRLLAPVLYLVCALFAFKTLAGLNTRVVGAADRTWTAEELVNVPLLGLAGVVGLSLALAHYSDDQSAAPIFFALVVPVICGIAGFRSGRRNTALRSGMYAAVGSLLVGATIWIVAEPLVAEGVLLTVFRDHPVPAAMMLVYWQGLSGVVFWAAMIGMSGALLGHISREETTRASASHP